MAPVSPLGQAELFVPAPTRKLIVARGATACWGVDPSTLRVAIATVTADERRGVSMASFPKLATAPRLVEIRRETLALARDLVETLPPGLIVVEKPAGFGDRPNPDLAYAAGAIICALQEAAPAAVLELVESARWKKVSCGSGGIRKPKPTSGEEYAVLTWARELGYSGSSWDECDSWAIAEYGRRTFALEPR